MKYLIYCGSGIGDFIMILPMVKSIKLHDKDAYIKVICASNKKRFSINRSLFKVQKYIDDIDYYSVNEKWHTLTMFAKIGIKSFDYGFVIQYTDNYSTSIVPSKIMKFATKISIGKRILNRPQIKYDMYVEKEDGIKQSDYFSRLLNKLNIKITTDYSDLIDSHLLGNVNLPFKYDMSKKNISLVIGTAPVSMKIEGKTISRLSKRWAYMNWFKLAERLSGLNYNVFLLGGQQELEEIRKQGLQSLCSSVYVLAGTLSIQQSLSILDKSEMVVGCDTGLMHCAGALDKPSLTLFGCTDYREYLPLGSKSDYLSSQETCSPCFGTEAAVLCEHGKCMKHITVEMVLDRIKKTIKDCA